LSKREIQAMRDRLADATQQMDADALARVLAVADIIRADVEWLAEYERKHRERVEMVADIMHYFPGKRADRKAAARRAVRRTLGTNI
jgi:hypothetical protein